jgi:hypothetical protein
MQLFVRLPGAPTVAVELVDERANVAALQQALEVRGATRCPQASGTARHRGHTLRCAANLQKPLACVETDPPAAQHMPAAALTPLPLSSHPPPQERTGIPAAEQLLTAGGRPLRSGAPHAALAHGATLDLLLRLAGGKGGFGALLRGQGRDGKITDNFDACRDLQGRRLKTVEAEKKLREWAAQAKERELEKLAAKHIRDLARQQRQERDYEVGRGGGWGPGRGLLREGGAALCGAGGAGWGGLGVPVEHEAARYDMLFLRSFAALRVNVRARWTPLAGQRGGGAQRAARRA